MKRQFMHLSPNEGPKGRPEQVQPGKSNLPPKGPPVSASGSPSVMSSPLTGSLRPGASGLLPNWRVPGPSSEAGILPDPSSVSPPDIADMETNRQAVVPDPHTEPGFRMGAVPKQPPISQSLPFNGMPQPLQTGPRQQNASVPVSMLGMGPMSMPGVALTIPPSVMPGTTSKKKRRVPIWARIFLGLLVVLIALTGTAAAWYYVNLSAPLSKITGQNVKRLGKDLGPVHTFGSGKRVNILLLGSDNDAKTLQDNGGALAQTDIVVTIDPTKNYVGMVSFPRDAIVPIDQNGTMDKLDKAYLSGGASQSRSTMYQAFGIKIDYYAWVGLDGFMKTVNTVNGVDVDVSHPITDDLYPDDSDFNNQDKYAMKRLYIAPGPQHLDGLQALEYVRSRHADLNGDFGRSLRQQQVINQLKVKLENPDLINKAPELLGNLQNSVKTDLSNDDLLNMIQYAKSLNSNKIERITLGPPYSDTKDNYGPNRESVVLLNCDKVRPVIARVFDMGDSAQCNVGGATGKKPSDQLAQANTRPDEAADAKVPGHNQFQLASQATKISQLSVNNQDQQTANLHSLLDLIFMTAMENPDAGRI